MSSLSEQFRQSKLKKQRDAAAFKQENELRAPFLQDDDDDDDFETSFTKPSGGSAVPDSSSTPSYHDPHFNAAQAFRDASQKSLRSLRSSRSSSEAADSFSERRHSGYKRDFHNSLEWGTTGGDHLEENLSKDFADQTGDTCGYCTIIAKRVSHTRCYTSFYLLLFCSGAVAAAFGVLNMVNMTKPDKRGYQFFAVYGGLLFFFIVDITIRLVASGYKRFCRRTFNSVDLFMVIISTAALVADAVPFHSDELNKYLMFGDTFVVVLMTYVS